MTGSESFTPPTEGTPEHGAYLERVRATPLPESPGERNPLDFLPDNLKDLANENPNAQPLLEELGGVFQRSSIDHEGISERLETARQNLSRCENSQDWVAREAIDSYQREVESLEVKLQKGMARREMVNLIAAEFAQVQAEAVKDSIHSEVEKTTMWWGKAAAAVVLAGEAVFLCSNWYAVEFMIRTDPILTIIAGNLLTIGVPGVALVLGEIGERAAKSSDPNLVEKSERNAVEKMKSWVGTALADFERGGMVPKKEDLRL